MAEQRVKEQERVTAFNAQKLVDEKAREEAERKLALDRTNQDLAKQRAAEQEKLLAHEKAFKDEIKRLADENAVKDVQRMAAQTEAERSASDREINLACLICMEMLKSGLQTVSIQIIKKHRLLAFRGLTGYVHLEWFAVAHGRILLRT